MTRKDALEYAAEAFPGFDRANMTLNGRTISLTDLMRRTNAWRKASGMPQVLYNEAWRAP